jgi:hypothetical protein
MCGERLLEIYLHKLPFKSLKLFLSQISIKKRNVKERTIMKDATNVILFYFFHDKFPVVGEVRVKREVRHSGRICAHTLEINQAERT